MLNELRNIANQIQINEIDKYNKLDNKILSDVGDFRLNALRQTNQFIKKLFDIEHGYINTSHPDYLGPENSLLN